LFVIATGAVLWGTLNPLIIDALGLGKISVGVPWFNIMFLLPMLPLATLLGVGMHTAWKQMAAEPLLHRLVGRPQSPWSPEQRCRWRFRHDIGPDCGCVTIGTVVGARR
jgi:hypothetical protein